MFDQVLLSLLVKRNLIISNKHGIHELPNDLRFRILGYYAISGKSQNLIGIVLSLPSKMKMFLILAKSPRKIDI